ncbi:MAG: IS91 family transposase [Planctomycetota bacterium]
MHAAAHAAAAGKCAEGHRAREAPAAARVPPARLEVADIFRQYGAEYRSTHTLLPSQTRTLQDILDCRTAALGGRLEKCDHCGHENPVYCSCGNRHCPKCQMLAKAKWLEARSAELLPLPYFHAVFTLPHVLNPLLFENQSLLYTLFFQTVAATLQEFAADTRHGLGGKLGFTAILHTWDQQLNYHVHLHCLIPAGALVSAPEKWIHARPDYLFNVEALSLVFRGKFRAGLQAAFEKGQLRFNAPTALWHTERAFATLLAQLYKTAWVVYLKPSFGGPRQTLDYLGRYTHRIAISNSRLLKLENGCVHFRYRDRSDGDRLKETNLSAVEFMRRFLHHVLPKGFVRLRHFGILANGCKKDCLRRCRHLLQAPPPHKPQHKTLQEWMKQLTGTDIARCPHCHTGQMVFLCDLPPQRAGRHPRQSQAPRQANAGDTS